jgi:hypothetical protein
VSEEGCAQKDPYLDALLLTTLKTIMSKKNKPQDIKVGKPNSVNGMMTFLTQEDGLHIADFASFEPAALQPYTATCKVQAMRDGNVYITEMPKRKHNNPLFREDNSSLTMGRDGRVYFFFSLPQEQLAELPEKLVHQAMAIAQKVERMTTTRKGGKR